MTSISNPTHPAVEELGMLFLKVACSMSLLLQNMSQTLGNAKDKEITVYFT